MTVKSKTIASTVVLAFVLAVLYAVRDEQQVLILSVGITPFPRDVPVAIAYNFGQGVGKEDATGPWQKTVVVKRGTAVAVGARQITKGALACSIREGNHVLDIDANINGQSHVSCSTGELP